MILRAGIVWSATTTDTFWQPALAGLLLGLVDEQEGRRTSDHGEDDADDHDVAAPTARVLVFHLHEGCLRLQVA